jgi:hypothetical protein
MAQNSHESGTERQERLKDEQHRPEQNEGYDEAARGGAGVPPSDIGVPLNPGDSDANAGDEFDRAAREAANDVRRREHSAD